MKIFGPLHDLLILYPERVPVFVWLLGAAFMTWAILCLTGIPLRKMIDAPACQALSLSAWGMKGGTR